MTQRHVIISESEYNDLKKELEQLRDEKSSLHVLMFIKELTAFTIGFVFAGALVLFIVNIKA